VNSEKREAKDKTTAGQYDATRLCTKQGFGEVFFSK
jgi:hypothetical protein